MGRCGSLGGMITDPAQHADYAALYRQAFREHGARALWSDRPVSDPTPEDALAITGTLRRQGDLRARALAERLEEACRRAAG